MAKIKGLASQIALSNKSHSIIDTKSVRLDSLSTWIEKYFTLRVTTAKSSRIEQQRDLRMFLHFFVSETREQNPDHWTPRLSAEFKTGLQKILKEDGTAHYSDRTINRILAHIKTFATWMHEKRPFPLGYPLNNVKAIPTESLLSIERAITTSERRRILDAADLLILTGGRSKDRKRYLNVQSRPRRKGFRPYRNRAIVYTLIETGMRRAAVKNINITDVDFECRSIRTLEKGGGTHSYTISQQGLDAIKDYVDKERSSDATTYYSQALYLPVAATNLTGRLHANAINDVWNQTCKLADVHGRTPHCARHAMGKFLMESTGNVEAVQRQLGHKNATYSIAYSRITQDELFDAINSR